MKVSKIDRGETTYTVELNQVEVDVLRAILGYTTSVGDKDIAKATEDLYHELLEIQNELLFPITSDGLLLESFHIVRKEPGV